MNSAYLFRNLAEDDFLFGGHVEDVYIYRCHGGWPCGARGCVNREVVMVAWNVSAAPRCRVHVREFLGLNRPSRHGHYRVHISRAAARILIEKAPAA